MSFILFDTEDDSKELMESGKSGFDKRVTQIAAVTACGERFYNEGNSQQFLTWLLKRPEKFIYSLNIQYDLGNLFSKCLDAFDATLVGGRIIKALWKNKVFLDVFNIWPMSVKALGKKFGLAKLEFDAKSKEYVFRDVEIIRRAMLFAHDFANEMDIENVPPTLGGLCVKVWKHLGGVNCHNSDDLCRKALFGGRVELFKQKSEANLQLDAMGKADCGVAWTDVNSLYPHVMRNKFPGVLEDCGDELAEYGIADVTIKLPKTEIACLPFRTEEGEIYYGYGKIRGVWAIVEIKAAIERGAELIQVHECQGSNDGFHCYHEFVSTLYERRKNSLDEAEKQFLKLLMNNLYGRLGTSGVIGRTVWRDEDKHIDGIPFGDKVLAEYSMPLSEETNWSHAAYVTAYGRLELLRYMEMVGAAKMIYCDTDSCIFDCQDGNIPFGCSNELGEMKLERCCSVCRNKFPHDDPCNGGIGLNFWDGAEIYAPKMYQVGSDYKAKGVPKRKAKEFILTGKAVYDMPFKYREAVRFYDPRQTPSGKIETGNTRELSVWRSVVKENKQNYQRKKLIGNRFFPCDLSRLC